MAPPETYIDAELSELLEDGVDIHVVTVPLARCVPILVVHDEVVRVRLGYIVWFWVEVWDRDGWMVRRNGCRR